MSFASFCHLHLFVICIFLSFASFFSFKETQFLFIHIILFIHPVICPPVIHLVVISPVIHQVIWCFPILLTTSLSYPMAIFSANEIRTFLIIFWFKTVTKRTFKSRIICLTNLDSKNVFPKLISLIWTFYQNVLRN